MKWWWMIWLLMLSWRGQAAIRWTGLAGNGYWSDPGNWEGGKLPGESEDVLLDNSLLSSGYTITLPAFQVTVRSLTMMPGEADSIKVIIPADNLLSSPSGSMALRAFVTTGIGYTLLIGPGAVFINASGSNSGYAMRIADSIQIRNGGSYIHRTRTGHAELVQFLSRQTGTERGIVRFENTDAAATISLSGRVYGTLQLSAAASAGHLAYSSSGTNPVHIRGDLTIEQGVYLALNLEDTLHVGGNLVMTNAMFNLASNNRSAVLMLKGHWYQQAGAITASNSFQKTATLLLQGSERQEINSTGTLGDGVDLAVDNSAGVKLLSPLTCPSRLSLINGIIYTTVAELLILDSNATLIADSLRWQAFIDGPLLKKGLDSGYTFFPVGGKGKLRWLAARGIAGDCQVAYHAEQAGITGAALDPGLDHLSAEEYWELNANIQDGSVELSFDQLVSGGVTDLLSLRVAAYKNGYWTNAGNSSTTGMPTGNGSVTSEPLNGIETNAYYFTLASATSNSNPLPITIGNLWMVFSAGQWILNWEVDQPEPSALFFLELSVDGIVFKRIASIKAVQDKKHYDRPIPGDWQGGLCRIVLVRENGSISTSKSILFGHKTQLPEQIQVFHLPGSPYLGFKTPRQGRVRLELFDFSGKLVQAAIAELPKGNSKYKILEKPISRGGYILKMTEEKGNSISRVLCF